MAAKRSKFRNVAPTVTERPTSLETHGARPKSLGHLISYLIPGGGRDLHEHQALLAV